MALQKGEWRKSLSCDNHPWYWKTRLAKHLSAGNVPCRVFFLWPLGYNENRSCRLAEESDQALEILRSCRWKELLPHELQSAPRRKRPSPIWFLSSANKASIFFLCRCALPDDLPSLAYSQQELSVREQTVVQLIAEGRSTKAVASALHISTKMQRLIAKLGLYDIAQVTRDAIANGIVPAISGLSSAGSSTKENTLSWLTLS